MPLLTDKSALGSPDLTDLMHVVDVSDNSGSLFGTSKKLTLGGLQNLLQATDRPTGSVFYVHKAGNDGQSGLTPSLALQTISAAITKATALVPAENNQLVIEVLDAGNYLESPTLIEWVHIEASNAALDGRLTVADNTIVRFRRLQNTLATSPVVRKLAGTGFARVTVDLLIVSDSSQEGLLVDSGVSHLDVAVLTVDAGVGIKAKNGSRVSFTVAEVQLSNGGTGLGTRVAGGSPNEFSGNILSGKDDGTGTLIETRVSGDTINIQGGTFDVDTLFDLGANSTLNAFVNQSSGARIADPTALIHVMKSSGGGTSIRASWLAPGTPPEFQLCLTNDTPQAIAFSGLTLTEPANIVTLNNALGEFTFLEDVGNADVSISIQVSRGIGGGGSVLWGVYFQVWDGISAWLDVPDSTRYLSFDKESAGELQNLSFVARTGSILAGSIYRVVQICSDVTKDVGIISAKPFTNAPLSAGIVLSVGN